MARYLTQDLNVDLGDEMPEDTTLNMLQFRERQTTLVILAVRCPSTRPWMRLTRFNWTCCTSGSLR